MACFIRNAAFQRYGRTVCYGHIRCRVSADRAVGHKRRHCLCALSDIALLKCVRNSVNLTAERRAEHEQQSAGNADCPVGEHIQGVVHRRISPRVVKAVIARVFAEVDRARDDVEDIAHNRRQHKTACKSDKCLELRGQPASVHKGTEYASAQSEYGEGNYVVEEELQGVQDIRSLQKLQKSVDKARQRTAAHAEHIRIKGYGQQREQRYRAAVGRFEHFDIGKTRRKSHGQRGVHQRKRVRARSHLLAVDEQKSYQYAEHHYDRHGDPHGVRGIEHDNSALAFACHTRIFRIETSAGRRVVYIENYYHDKVDEHDDYVDDDGDFHLLFIDKEEDNVGKYHKSEQDNSHADGDSEQRIEIEEIRILGAK